MSCSSMIAARLPLMPEISCRISWRTRTKTSVPLRPFFSLTSATVERRRTASPMASGSRNSMRLPAHMRRGSGTGGRKPPRFGWPSGPSCACACIGRKYSQCHSSGKRSPVSQLVAWRSSVAASAVAGVGAITSLACSRRPIHCVRLTGSTDDITAAIALPGSDRAPAVDRELDAGDEVRLVARRGTPRRARCPSARPGARAESSR